MAGVNSKSSMQDAFNDFAKSGRFDARSFLRKPRGGTADEEEAALSAFKARLKVLVLLDQLPLHESHNTVQSLEAKLAKNQVGNKEEYWPSSVKTIRQIPKPWKASLLMRVAPGLNLTQAVIEDIDSKDADTISEVFCYLFGVHDDMPVPEAMLHMVIAERVLSKRFRELGRLTQWWLTTVWTPALTSGSVDWAVGGVFSVAASADNSGHVVKHCSGCPDSDLPSYISTQGGLSIEENFSDQKAALPMGNRRMYFREFFPKLVGPNTLQVANPKGKGRADDITRFVRQVAAERQRVQAPVRPEQEQLSEAFDRNAQQRRQASRRPAPVAAKRRRSSVALAAGTAAPMTPAPTSPGAVGAAGAAA